MKILVTSTLARNPEERAENDQHAVTQQWGPYEYHPEAAPESAHLNACMTVESIFARVLLPGESLTLEAALVS
jgi:hypothetical protein